MPLALLPEVCILALNGNCVLSSDRLNDFFRHLQSDPKSLNVLMSRDKSIKEIADLHGFELTNSELRSWLARRVDLLRQGFVVDINHHS